MVSIKDRKILRQMFSHYDYVMTTAQLSKEKLYYRDIQRMLGAGLIEKVKRGYYHWTMGSGKGDVVIISRLFPDGILCMETALFYYAELRGRHKSLERYRYAVNSPEAHAIYQRYIDQINDRYESLEKADKDSVWLPKATGTGKPKNPSNRLRQMR